MRDEPDPDEHAMELVMPFVVTKSHGGPYEDEAFVAGYQAGTIHQALHTAASVAATRVEFPDRPRPAGPPAGAAGDAARLPDGESRPYGLRVV